MQTKYTQPEIERRWLVDPGRLPDLKSLQCTTIVDRYIAGTRLRLRRMHSPDEIIYKLCKKYGKHSQFTEHITNIYLSSAEYELLTALPATLVTRERYLLEHAGNTMSINVPTGNHPVISECEFESIEAARAFVPPEFCTEDVSDREEYEAWRFSDGTE